MNNKIFKHKAMKKLFLIAILIVCFISVTYSQQYGWISLSEVLPNESFSDVYAIENQVWITSSSSSELYYSDNGGISEFTTYSTPDDFICIHMVNSSLGYAGSYNGGVYKTDNGGTDWTLLFPLTGAAVNDINFPPGGGEPGYCCGEAGNISSITSSGTTSMTNLIVALTSITFPVSSSEGWVCGIDIIYHYNGTTWVGQGGPSGTRNGIHFVDNNNGWIVGSDGNGNGQIIHTTNGGTNWTLQTDPSPSSGSLAKVFFLNAQEGWAGGNFGRVLYTSDGGDNWSTVNTGATSLIRGIYFTSPNNGYIVGNDGNAFKYTQLSSSNVQPGENDFDFSIFPNPFNNKIQVSSPIIKSNDGAIQIFSLEGKLLMEYKFTRGEEIISLNISGLKAGTLLCKVMSDNKSSVQKIIKK